MILIVLAALILSALRVVGEIVFERTWPKRTAPLFVLFICIALYALTNL